MRILQSPGGAELMSAGAVESLLGIDKSTVYRMAQDGRLPAIKVGRQWRFPVGPIRGLLEGAGIGLPSAAQGPHSQPSGPFSTADAPRLQPIVDLAAELLGVMMVVTDMEGHPASEVANPCAWFADRRDDPTILDACVKDWHVFANEQAFAPTFRIGPHGFECARALVREGNQLVGMVLAGGIAPGDVSADESPDLSDGLYHVSAADRAALLAALPRVAASLTRVATQPEPTPRSD